MAFFLFSPPKCEEETSTCGKNSSFQIESQWRPTRVLHHVQNTNFNQICSWIAQRLRYNEKLRGHLILYSTIVFIKSSNMIFCVSLSTFTKWFRNTIYIWQVIQTIWKHVVYLFQILLAFTIFCIFSFFQTETF